MIQSNKEIPEGFTNVMPLSKTNQYIVPHLLTQSHTSLCFSSVSEVETERKFDQFLFAGHCPMDNYLKCWRGSRHWPASPSIRCLQDTQHRLSGNVVIKIRQSENIANIDFKNRYVWDLFWNVYSPITCNNILVTLCPQTERRQRGEI